MIAQPENQRPTVFSRAAKILGPRPGIQELNVICWLIFFSCILLPTCLVLALQYKNGNLYFERSPVDFIYFYGTGRIAQTHPAIDVYDYRLQLSEFNKVQRLSEGVYGPSPYPPFVSQFFRLFAKLGFVHAFLLWLVISLVLYIVAVHVALKEYLPDDRLKRSIILCFALAFPPFLFNTLGNGQLSVAGLCFLVLGIVAEKRSRPFWGGVSLSLMCYKPTLLIVIVPMLLLTRRFRVFSGLITGTAVLFVGSTAAAGVRIWPTYVSFLNSFGRASGVYGSTSLRLWKYVDLNSFSYGVRDGRSWPALTLLGSMILAIVVWASWVLWKSAGASEPQQSLTWAVAITWTMLVNVYYPIYDSIPIVLAVVLTISALRELAWGRALRLVILLAILVFAVSWITEGVAQRFGVQLLTLALMALAIVQTHLLRLGAKQPFVRPAPAPQAA